MIARLRRTDPVIVGLWISLVIVSLLWLAPVVFIALTAMIIGTQLFLAGFLGEMILRVRKNQDRYTIYETLNVSKPLESVLEQERV